MGKKISVLTIAFAVLAFTQPAYAQQAEKVYRVGYLGGSSIKPAFRQGLRELGYIEAQTPEFLFLYELSFSLLS